MRKKAARHLVPIIEERYRLPPDERPNDFLSWLMEDAVGEERDPHNLTLRVLGVNFAAIHAISLVSCFILARIYLTLNFSSRCSSQPCTNSWLSKSYTENYVAPSRFCQSRIHTASPGRSRVDRPRARLDQGVALQYAQTR